MRRILAPLLLTFAALPAAAQDAPCELHVWPAANMDIVRHRSFEGNRAGGLLDLLIKQEQERSTRKADARATDILAASDTPDPLSTAIQVETLKSLPIAEMMELSGYVVIIHDTALDSRTIRTVKTRYTETNAACYADLVTDDVVYTRAYANGRGLKTFFRFRDFGTQAAPVRSFGTWVDTRLKIFSLEPPNLSQPALDEIVSAFRTNATRFSELLRKRP
jgi:hypothetical protein